MKLSRKTEKLDLRVTREEKERIRRAAQAAGMEISAWVMGRLFEPQSMRFMQLVREAARANDSFSFATLADFLKSLSGSALNGAVGEFPADVSDRFCRAYAAAMVETVCACQGIDAPAWTSKIGPIDEPYFASTLLSLRSYLLTNSPPAFRKRNLFVDATAVDRV